MAGYQSTLYNFRFRKWSASVTWFRHWNKLRMIIQVTRGLPHEQNFIYDSKFLFHSSFCVFLDQIVRPLTSFSNGLCWWHVVCIKIFIYNEEILQWTNMCIRGCYDLSVRRLEQCVYCSYFWYWQSCLNWVLTKRKIWTWNFYFYYYCKRRQVKNNQNNNNSYCHSVCVIL